jgi:adenylate cyclase
MIWDHLGVAHFQARRYEEAVRAVNRLPRLGRWNYYYLAASYAHLGQIERAHAFGAEIQRVHPGFSLGHVGLTEAFEDQADLNHLLDGLRKAGLPES